ncbi:HalOD1 output domain-containing protein [Halogeometricum limi]|uniref:Halobacterial output domain-containing protein n=1 Tax=Halogeometricum limi TaxID=555875 RepID=A0A1I6FQK1_9EURY|nr:HalOD1 output domain-containing protein [Halogeometricum limi]SFR32168.1 hypothetical protein SAMN04488124_0073 [Halogeometricum limi]
MQEPKTVRVNSDESVCFTVVDAVADVRAIDPLELSPLGAVVDTDALDALFAPGSELTRPHDVDLTFEYEGCGVTVESGGTVSVAPVSAARPGDHR